MKRLFLIACLALVAQGARAETIKIGFQKGASPVYIARDKGYFTAEGLDAEIVYFEAGQPVAVAAVSGAIDFGIAGLTGGLYSLAEQGALRIIGGQTREAPGFRANTVVASKAAYAGGLRGLKDLAGHSVAVTQIGSAFHYDLGLLADKYGFDLKSIRLMPLQTNPNSVAAVIGGSADAAVSVYPYLAAALDKDEVKLLGYIGDEAPWQLTAVFTATATTNDKHDLVERFLRAFRNGTRDYHAAFTGPDERRKDGPTAPEILALMAKNTGESVERVAAGIGYVDRDARVDVEDIDHQVVWYKAQGLLKGDRAGAELVDMRYALKLSH